MIISFYQKKRHVNRKQAYQILTQIEDNMDEIYREICQNVRENLNEEKKVIKLVEQPKALKKEQNHTREINDCVQSMTDMLKDMEEKRTKIVKNKLQ